MGGEKSKIYVENWPYNSSCGSRENVKVGSFSQNNWSAARQTAAKKHTQNKNPSLNKEFTLDIIWLIDWNDITLKCNSHHSEPEWEIVLKEFVWTPQTFQNNI